jgi:hypothetical protein
VAIPVNFFRGGVGIVNELAFGRALGSGLSPLATGEPTLSTCFDKLPPKKDSPSSKFKSDFTLKLCIGVNLTETSNTRVGGVP